MEHEHHHKSPVGAIILITLGVLFLLSNLGILPISVWFILLRFWPVLLILLGLRIILGRGKNHEAFAFISFILIAVVIVVSIASVNSNMRAWMQSHMPWFPMQQMMPNPQSPFRMYNRRNQMWNNNNDFFNNQDNNSIPNYNF